MKIKILIVAIILAVSGLKVFAESIDSKIKHVTIYKQNAKIVREGSFQAEQGNSTIVISDLSLYVNANNIQVGLNNNVKLLSVSYRTNYLRSAKKSKELSVLKDSLELLSYQISWIRDQKEIYTGEEKVILANNRLGSNEDGMKVEDLKALTTFYTKRLMEIRKELIDLKVKEAKLLETKTRIQRQVTQLNSGIRTSVGEIVIEVSSGKATSTSFELSYVVRNVSWVPIYDLSSDGMNQDVTLTYKANVYQNTGVDWDEVPITVSTGNPNINNSRPILGIQYLGLYEPQKYAYERQRGSSTYKKAPAMANIRVVEDAEAAPEKEEVKYDAYVPMKVVENQMNVEFIVEQDYVIPSDGQYHAITMTSFKMPADYEYHTVPVMDKGAYLLAKVTDWGKYSLLPGNANIFFENTYVGKSYINPNITSDTLLFSFGRDSRIQVEREKVFKECETKTTLTSKKKNFVYKIKVRNTKSKAVELEIMDRMPIANNKDIEVELEDKAGADLNEETGRLLWKLNLAPNETKTIIFRYSVKYPKNKVIQGL